MKIKAFYTLPDQPYMVRMEILRLFRWSLKLHVLLQSDPDIELHDHPWDFWSLVLAGKYVEQQVSGNIFRRPWSLAYRKAETRHRILIESGECCVTLVLARPKRREWGFWQESPGVRRFIPWQRFVAERGREKR